MLSSSTGRWRPLLPLARSTSRSGWHARLPARRARAGACTVATGEQHDRGTAAWGMALCATGAREQRAIYPWASLVCHTARSTCLHAALPLVAHLLPTGLRPGAAWASGFKPRWCGNGTK